jgi:sugar O-acyltransferase (sialic acid O-acetyltransferase NeuD family)
MEDTQFNNSEIIIIGAGGLAREIVSWQNISGEKRNIIGCMDDFYDSSVENTSVLNVIGKIDFNSFSENQDAICAIADCDRKQSLFEEAKLSRIKFIQYVHNTCLIGERTNVGEGLVLLPYGIISCDAEIGDLVFINNGSQIGHDVKIGNFTSIMANVDIGGGAKIGNNVFIGSNAVVLPGVIIPDNTRIGAGSVVLKSIRQVGTYFGNPAKKIF